MHRADLERLVDAELRKLAVPQAPRTLLPRVLSAAQNWALRPWYTRAWFTWPLAWQAVAICALVLSAWGGLTLMSVVYGAMSGGSSAHVVASAANDVAGFIGRTAVIVEAGQDLCRTLLAPIARVVFAIVMVMYVACAVFGVALNHVIFERA
jgi:hypothetical protein